MGFLELGTPLTWEESQKVIKHVKAHGLRQFLHTWKMNRSRYDEILCWGDELEYFLVTVDGKRQQSQIYVGVTELIDELKLREHIRSKEASAHLSSEWHPEFGNHMIEALPSPPYLLNLNSLLILEPSMRLRRAKIQSLLPEGRYVTSLPTFPRFGLNGFVDADNLGPGQKCVKTGYKRDQDVTRSIFVTDNVMNQHPRFPTLVRNITARRNACPYIKIPVYKDTYTGSQSRPQNTGKKLISPYAKHTDFEAEEDALYAVEGDWSHAVDVESLDRFKVQEVSEKTVNPVKDHIYMDCMGFGMGMSCVQTTFACPTIDVARYIYDQLTVLAPIFLALSASTPFHRGLLSDYDTRWSALEQAVDCRTEAEETGDLTRDHSACKATSAQHIPKSRYSGVSLFIANHPLLEQNEDILNDTQPPINKRVYENLRCEGVDHLLAQHYAYLWLRDPLVIFNERVYLDDTKAVDHFENIQSTNWNSVRFKPPPRIGHEPSPIAWRVEFRSPDIQLTDFDNAANVALISVIVQAILHYQLCFYIPMSMCEINMQRSWKRDAITKEKFYFRTHLYPTSSDELSSSIEQMSVYEILAGKPEFNYIGLIPLCEQYIQHVLLQQHMTGQTSPYQMMDKRSHIPETPETSPLLPHNQAPDLMRVSCYPVLGSQVRSCFSSYATLQLNRASGKLQTCAQFLRQFSLSHPRYRKDSIINPTICYDVTVLSILLGLGVCTSPALHGEFIARYLIQQTPLPAELLLPTLSYDASKIIYWLHEKELDEKMIDLNKAGSKIILLKKRTIALNEINSIYTMPLGVTARTANLQKIGIEDIMTITSNTSRDLAQLTIELLECNNRTIKRNPNSTSPPQGPLPSVISSEEFTQAWMLKGFDYVGESFDQACMDCTSSLIDEGMDSASCLTIKKTDDIIEKASTICPSGCDERSPDDDFSRLHELSRSYSFGFKDEQELEYFRQVCEASG